MAPETPAADVAQPPGAPVRGLSRRSVVRAGVAAVWAAPVVTLVTAAPAMAASTTLTVTGFTATYQNNPNPATVNPDVLIVHAVLGNTGAQATAGHQFIVSVPGGLVDSVSAVPAPGFSGPVVSGSLGGGWTVVFTKSGPQIDAGGSVAFDTTLTLGSTTASPYRGYRGAGFALSGTASATNATTAGGAASVQPTPNSALSAGISLTTTATSGPAFSMDGTDVAVSGVSSASRSGIGQLFLSVALTRSTKKNSRLLNAPTQGAVGPGWVADGTAHTAAAWVFRYRSTGLGFAGSLAAAPAARGPVTFHSELTLNGGKGNPSGDATWTLTADHLTTYTTTAKI